MKKIAVFLLGLGCSAVLLAQTAIADLNDIQFEDINKGQLVAEAVAQIRQDCTLLAQFAEIEAEYLSGFVEVCVIDNVAMALADEQGEEITDEMPVEEYAEAAMDLEPFTSLVE